MDPNETLKKIRQLIDWVYHCDDINLVADNDLLEMCDLISGLDEWLSNGGLFPTEWIKKRIP